MSNFCKINFFCKQKVWGNKTIGDKRKKRFQARLKTLARMKKILRAEGRLFQSQLTLMQKSIVCFKANVKDMQTRKQSEKKWGFATQPACEPHFVLFSGCKRFS